MNAPKITEADIENNILGECYLIPGQVIRTNNPEMPIPEGLDRLTICVLVLANGFVVTGESCCVSTENFDPALGQQYARKKAADKVWELMGYELRSRVASGVTVAE